jgi:hypothetical protein
MKNNELLKVDETRPRADRNERHAKAIIASVPGHNPCLLKRSKPEIPPAEPRVYRQRIINYLDHLQIR